MEKYLRISSYIRKPFLIYDFATAPLWISLYVRKIFFPFFISVVTCRGTLVCGPPLWPPTWRSGSRIAVGRPRPPPGQGPGSWPPPASQTSPTVGWIRSPQQPGRPATAAGCSRHQIHVILVWIRIRIRGSMPLTNGSGSFYNKISFFLASWRSMMKIAGSGDPCLWLTDPDPDAAIFIIDLQEAKKN